MSLSRGIGDPLSPLGKDRAFVKTQNCLRLRSRHFLGFTQALAFPTGNNGSYIPPLAGIPYILNVLLASFVSSENLDSESTQH